MHPKPCLQAFKEFSILYPLSQYCPRPFNLHIRCFSLTTHVLIFSINDSVRSHERCAISKSSLIMEVVVSRKGCIGTVGISYSTEKLFSERVERISALYHRRPP